MTFKGTAGENEFFHGFFLYNSCHIILFVYHNLNFIAYLRLEIS